MATGSEMSYDDSTKCLDIYARLMALGLRPNHLMFMGAFITVYGMFETTLERALWVLKEANVDGVRPFTENMNTKSQFEMLGNGSAKLSDKCNSILRIAALAAEDLNEYRNSLVHGYLLPYGPDSAPCFLKNPRWYGEVRNKAVGDAYIDEPIQELVLIATWNLLALVQQVENVFTDHSTQQTIEKMEVDVARARNYASEVRHLRSLMNHEKY